MSRRLRRGCIAAFMRFVSFTVWEGTEVLSASVDMHRIHGMGVPVRGNIALDTQAAAEELFRNEVVICWVLGWVRARRELSNVEVLTRTVKKGMAPLPLTTTISATSSRASSPMEDDDDNNPYFNTVVQLEFKLAGANGDIRSSRDHVRQFLTNTTPDFPLGIPHAVGRTACPWQI
ncbi:hypothetical protein EDB85DRAFT_1892961 [Lactarius pseudohatsudake]|nr:hypothetical protein EDB85DRAFT_1892961 [Lactarius pseudohatsudake]